MGLYVALKLSILFFIITSSLHEKYYPTSGENGILNSHKTVSGKSHMIFTIFN